MNSLTEERQREQLSRRAESLQVVAQAISSALELKTLLPILVKKVVEVLEVERGTICLPDERLETIADFVTFGVPEEQLSLLTALKGRRIADFPIGEQLLEATEPIVIPNAGESDLIPRDLVEALGMRATMAVPIRSKGKAIAVLFLDTSLDRAFTSGEAAVAKAIADQAAVAIENARLYERLAASEAEYRSIFENAVIGIYRSTPEGKVLTANPTLARMLGYDSVEELLKVSALDLHIHPENRTRWQDELERRGVVESEGQLQRRDGTIIWVRDMARVVRDSTGRALYYEGTLTDITEQKRADEAVRLAERRYREIFEEAPVMYVIARIQDGVAIIADCNEAFLNTLGYTRDEVLEQPLANFYTPNSQVKLRGGYQRVIAGMFLAEERELLARDGRVVKVLLRALPERDAEGAVIGTRTMYVDVTEQKQAEEALRRSQQQYQRLVESVSDLVFSLDTEGCVTYVNTAVQQFGGYLPEDVMGKPLTDFVHPDDWETVRQIMARRLAGDTRPGEFRVVAKNGDVHDVQSMGQYVLEGGHIIGFTGVLRDVTEKRRAEERLARIYDVVTRYQGQELFDRAAATLAELLDMPYVFIGELEEGDRSLQMLAFYNQGSIEHGRRYDLRSMACERVIASRRLHVYAQRAREIFPEDADLRGLDIESYIGAPIMSSQGEVIGAVVALDKRQKKLEETDARILEIIGQRIGAEIIRLRGEEAQRKLQEQLFQAQRMESVGTLAGGIAHEFNNLLTGIMGFTEMALLKVEPTSKLGEYLNRVVSLSGRARDLVKQLLLFSHPTAKEKVACDLNEFLNGTVGLLRRAMPESIRMELALTSEEIFVEANPAQLQQVFVNLAVNARDAMPEGGRLSIQTRRVLVDEATAQAHTNVMPGPFVCVAVSDTGEGIPPRVLPHVFDPFFTTKEVGKGTGLGLSVAYGIVKAHGGWIEAESQAGAGASFHVYLPQVKRVMQPEVSEVEEEIVGGRETILLVEDEPTVLELGRTLLETLGYRVLTARDGREAVEVYAKNQEGIDLILLDVVMPEMSGHRAFGEMRAMNPQVKVLLVTGYSLEEVAEELLRQGAEGIVQKPFGLKSLAQAVRRALDQKDTECKVRWLDLRERS